MKDINENPPIPPQDENLENVPEVEQKKQGAVSAMYQTYFLDYASYVILERAIPAIDDGLKPVQRRILHSMFTMDDGRFHKVANVIGQTMQYHPHGDAAIGEALVNLGQKDLMIDCQGNWGDIRTGDSAAAARYIEARLSKFALEIAFNPQTTHFQLSYDGRKNEPLNLPVKFPLLLAQGVEGIAVGLSTKILPHNFIELIKASIEILKGKSVQIFPDFPTGGMLDASNYNGGRRGGKARVRAKIEIADNKKSLIIREIPFGTTTESLIDSILKAAAKNKIKVKKVIDNTAADVEIVVELPPGTSPELTMDALYAFTDCEMSISTNACVIVNEKPVFYSVEDILEHSTHHTRDLLQWELENAKKDLEEKWHFANLEKIFIENRIYQKIENCETWEAVMETIRIGLQPFVKNLWREVTDDDIVKLTEIRIKRISKFNKFQADEFIRSLEEQLKEVKANLENLTEYTIEYFKNLLKKYSKGRERKTQLIGFDTIIATEVVANNAKLYINREEGFIGMGLKKDEFVCDCSDIDDIIIFHKDGTYFVIKIAEKVFVGKDPLHVAVWRKNDERMIYNLIYTDLKDGVTYAKRFNVTGVTRDRKYEVGDGIESAKAHYFSANPNGEAEVVQVQLSQGCSAKIKQFDFNFAELMIKGRRVRGNMVTKYPIRKIKIKEQGISTLGAIKVWLDEATGKLNHSSIGRFLGEFRENDRIATFYQDGTYELTNYDVLTNRFEVKDIMHIGIFDPEEPISAVYYDGERQSTYAKRFKIETTSTNQRFDFIPNRQNKATQLLLLTLEPTPRIEYKVKNIGGELNLNEFVDVMNSRAVGNKISDAKLTKVALLSPTVAVDEEDTKTSDTLF